MRRQSTAQTALPDTDTSTHYMQPERTSETSDAQRRVIQRVVQKIPHLISTPRDETTKIPAPTAETTATGEDDHRELPKVVNMPRILNLERPCESFVAVQEWEGVVTKICSDVFLADLVDITTEDNEANELAEIPIADVQEQDRQLFSSARYSVG